MIGTGVISLHFSTIACICAGVVPQQPPANQAPMVTISFMSSANSSAPTSKTVFPFSERGSPAFGLTITGMEAYFSSSFTISFICFGPRPQLIPSASTPSPSNSDTTTCGLAPVNIFLLSSKMTVAMIGNVEFSFAANTAAFSS